jgi:hypothetical protein
MNNPPTPWLPASPPSPPQPLPPQPVPAHPTLGPTIPAAQILQQFVPCKSGSWFPIAAPDSAIIAALMLSPNQGNIYGVQGVWMIVQVGQALFGAAVYPPNGNIPQSTTFAQCGSLAGHPMSPITRI